MTTPARRLRRDMRASVPPRHRLKSFPNPRAVDTRLCAAARDLDPGACVVGEPVHRAVG